MLGKLSVPGRPTVLDSGQAPAALIVGAGGVGFVRTFSLVFLFSLFSPSLWETVRYRLNYCLNGPFL